MPLSGKQLVKLVQENGWVLIRINGGHHILAKEGKVTCAPVHGNKSLGKGLELKIIKQTGVKIK